MSRKQFKNMYRAYRWFKKFVGIKEAYETIRFYSEYDAKILRKIIF